MSQPQRPESPVVSLLTLAAMWDTRLGEVLQDCGLTTRKFGLLAHINGSPDLSFSDLARRSGITVQSAHTAVRGLVAASFVQDAMAHAGAASALRVTKAGRAALEVARERVAMLDAEFRMQQPELADALRGRHEDAAAS